MTEEHDKTGGVISQTVKVWEDPYAKYGVRRGYRCLSEHPTIRACQCVKNENHKGKHRYTSSADGASVEWAEAEPEITHRWVETTDRWNIDIGKGDIPTGQARYTEDGSDPTKGGIEISPGMTIGLKPNTRTAIEVEIRGGRN